MRCWAKWWFARAIRRVAEPWFDSLEAMGSDDPDTAQTNAELFDDEMNFIDLANSPMWIAEENVVVD